MYVRAYARENECVHARNDVGEMTTEGRKNSAGGAPSSKDYPIIKKNENSPLLRFFSYTVSPTSEIVFSTSEVDFPISEFFSVVVVGGRISATLSIPIFAPSGDALFGIGPSVGSSFFVLLAYG